MQINYRGSKFMISVLVLMLALAFALIMYKQTSSPSVSMVVMLGFFLAVMDTSIGMGFGTFGTPILLIAGFSSIVVVPSILASQFFSSSLASILHRRYKNADVLDLKGRDGKIAMIMVGMGTAGSILGVLIALKLSKVYINTYIGLLVIAMGLLLVLKPRFSFSWMKLTIISLVGGFNKAISGGGYGPITTSGLLASGNNVRNSVGISVFSVAVITFVGLILYLLSRSVTSFTVITALSVGAVLGSQVGPKITHKLEPIKDTNTIGIMALALGALTIIMSFW